MCNSIDHQLNSNFNNDGTTTDDARGVGPPGGMDDVSENVRTVRVDFPRLQGAAARGVLRVDAAGGLVPTGGCVNARRVERADRRHGD